MSIQTQSDFDQYLIKALKDKLRVETELNVADSYWDSNTLVTTVFLGDEKISTTKTYLGSLPGQGGGTGF